MAAADASSVEARESGWTKSRLGTGYNTGACFLKGTSYLRRSTNGTSGFNGSVRICRANNAFKVGPSVLTQVTPISKKDRGFGHRLSHKSLFNQQKVMQRVKTGSLQNKIAELCILFVYES